MKKILLTILMVISFSSCSVTPRITPKQRGINPEFKPYIEEYRNIIGKHLYKDRFKTLHMNFTELEGNVLGRCWWLINGEKEVEIDKHWWKNRAGFYDRQYTVYHELEHCIRYRMHTDLKENIENFSDFWEELIYRLGFIEKPGFFEDGCPVSIMNSESTNYECQFVHYNDYINEMQSWDD